MKNLLAILTLLILTAGFLSCESDEESTPAGTLQVLATYTGAEAIVTEPPATEEIYVYVFDETLANTDKSRGFLYSTRTNEAVTPGTQYTLTIDNIPPGDYKVAVFYDGVYGNSNLDNNGDAFIFISGQTTPATADIVTIEDDTTEVITQSFNGDNVLVDGAYFVDQGK